MATSHGIDSLEPLLSSELLEARDLEAEVGDVEAERSSSETEALDDLAGVCLSLGSQALPWVFELLLNEPLLGERIGETILALMLVKIDEEVEGEVLNASSAQAGRLFWGLGLASTGS